MMTINSKERIINRGTHTIKLEISPKFNIITTQTNMSPRQLYPLSAKNVTSMNNERKARLLQQTKNTSVSPNIRLKFQTNIKAKLSINSRINIGSSSNNHTVAVNDIKSIISPVTT